MDNFERLKRFEILFIQLVATALLIMAGVKLLMIGVVHLLW